MWNGRVANVVRALVIIVGRGGRRCARGRGRECLCARLPSRTLRRTRRTTGASSNHRFCVVFLVTGPVQFEKDEDDDVFGLDKFFTEAKAGKKLDNIGKGSTMIAGSSYVPLSLPLLTLVGFHGDDLLRPIEDQTLTPYSLDLRQGL